MKAQEGKGVRKLTQWQSWSFLITSWELVSIVLPGPHPRSCSLLCVWGYCTCQPCLPPQCTQWSLSYPCPFRAQVQTFVLTREWRMVFIQGTFHLRPSREGKINPLTTCPQTWCRCCQLNKKCTSLKLRDVLFGGQNWGLKPRTQYFRWLWKTVPKRQGVKGRIYRSFCNKPVINSSLRNSWKL